MLIFRHFFRHYYPQNWSFLMHKAQITATSSAGFKNYTIEHPLFDSVCLGSNPSNPTKRG
jgi:hypothetical protein